MKRVAFSTLGCKVNQYDTDVMKASFMERGYSCVDFSDEADIYIVNTCTVTAVAARKSRQMAAKARKTNPGAIVAVTGCLGQLESDNVMKMTGADIVTGNVEKNKIVDLIEEHSTEPFIQAEDIFKESDYVQEGNSVQDSRTRIFIKVQDGCDNFCSYCTIPFARGRSRSRKPDDVVSEIKRYAESGAKEIVITGIHLDSYGKDLGDITLIGLLERIDKIDCIQRIRLGSLEPASITEEFAVKASKLEKLCPHFHLSLQSGSDTVLERMRRRYTTAEFAEAAGILRSNFGEATLTADIIVGFPGETESEFDESVEFVNGMDFTKVHVFKFSPRKGTLAYGMKGRVPGDVKKARSERMIEAAASVRSRILSKLIGKRAEVLIEQECPGKKGYWEGHTKGYVKVVFECGECRPNESVMIEIEEISGDFVSGTLKTGV
jgi:threonylcarbamoyladenosine tRNA methylthiotransferase MtaB